MKYLKMYERFDDHTIHRLCEIYKIRNYTINNGLVDVDGNVDLYGKGLSELPLKFGIVTGYFLCSHNQLTTLKGCPKEVGDYFSCAGNKLISLEGSPKSVVGSFVCRNNPVFEIYKLFRSYKSFVDSLDYNYFRGGNKINKIRLTQALEEIGLECPDKIKGYIWE